MSARAAISRLLIIVLVLLSAYVDQAGRVSVRASGVLAASPDSIGETLTSRQQVTRSLVITNTGQPRSQPCCTKRLRNHRWQ
jgi:hypothetical protein